MSGALKGNRIFSSWKRVVGAPGRGKGRAGVGRCEREDVHAFVSQPAGRSRVPGTQTELLLSWGLDSDDNTQPSQYILSHLVSECWDK